MTCLRLAGFELAGQYQYCKKALASVQVLQFGSQFESKSTSTFVNLQVGDLIGAFRDQR